MKVVATFHPPSSVTSSLRCTLSTQSELGHLVIAKANRVEVSSITAEGLKHECSLEVWGRILSIKAVPAKVSERDLYVNGACVQLMGIETSADLGGSESSFTSAIIAIEELAKVDPSVSVMCDVHNTLVNTVLRKYGTTEQQQKWLPQLAESKVRVDRLYLKSVKLTFESAWKLLSI